MMIQEQKQAAKTDIEQLLAAAADYVARGFQVKPLKGKSPRVHQWQFESFDLADLRRHLETYDDPAIGVQLGPTSGIVDFEWDSEAQYAQILELFEWQLPDGPEFKSRKGGHKLFAWDDRLHKTHAADVSFTCDNGEKLKVRLGAAGKGSQSAFPPSPNKAWLPGKSLADLAIPKLPESVIEKLLRQAKPIIEAATSDLPTFTASETRLDEIWRERLLTLPDAIEGHNGHDKILTAACEILRAGVNDDEQGAELILRFNAEKCVPPFEEADALRKWEQAKIKQPVVHPTLDFADDLQGELTGEPLTLGLLRWSQFQAADFPQRYLVPGLVAEGESFVIGGRTKGCKTLVTTDMMISVASGQPFLGHFPIPGPSPVAFFSGESGKATLQRVAKLMAEVRGAKIIDDNFFIGFDLPRISRLDHLTALDKFIRHYGIKLCCIDPAYLATLNAANADRASNQFAMGLILKPYGRIGLETGCVMGLVHHARKTSKAEAYTPMTRDDLTQSGFDAWMRQWLLLSRRSAFHRGIHELYMEAGGSAGHCGAWHVTIDEGQPADELIGRRWNVTVTDADEGRLNDLKAAAKAKAERLDLDIQRIRSVLLTRDNRGMSKSAIRETAGLNTSQTEAAISAMIAAGELEECEYIASNHKTPKAGGYRLALPAEAA